MFGICMSHLRGERGERAKGVSNGVPGDKMISKEGLFVGRIGISSRGV